MKNEKYFNSLFVPPNVAKQLDEVGFNEPCLGFYVEDETTVTVTFPSLIRNSEVLGNASSAPLYQQATEYLRTKHKIHVAASSYPIHNNKYGYQMSPDGSTTGGWNPCNESHYGALCEGILKAVEVIKYK